MTIVATFHHRGVLSAWAPWDRAAPAPFNGGFAWIDAVDPSDDEIAALQRTLGLHELAVEDSMGPAQLAKVDLYPDHVFIIAKIAELGERTIAYTDIGIFLSDHVFLTICRTSTPLGARLRDGPRRLASREAATAAYALHDVLDLVVDDYLPVVEMIAEEVLRIEQRLLDSSLDRDDIARIFQLRRETIHFQHVLTRMSDVCNKLATLDIPCVEAAARPYFRDVLDHLARIEAMSTGLVDVIRASLEASGLLEQQRQSAITRQLAAWAAILGVPTAIAGIYGMNFVNMPETRLHWGYYAILGVMMLICVGLYWRFRNLGWLGRGNRRGRDGRRPHCSEDKR